MPQLELRGKRGVPGFIPFELATDEFLVEKYLQLRAMGKHVPRALIREIIKRRLYLVYPEVRHLMPQAQNESQLKEELLRKKVLNIAHATLQDIYDMLNKSLLTSEEAHEAIKELRRDVMAFGVKPDF